VVEHRKFPELDRAGDGAGDKFFCSSDGVVEVVTEREPCCDGGGEGAAGAMRMDTTDVGAFEDADVVTSGEDVRGGVALEMAALEQDGAAKFFLDGVGGFAHGGDARDFIAEEDFCFVEVGGDECGQGKQLLHEVLHGGGFEQARPAGGDHDGINHHGSFFAPSEDGGHGDADEVGGEEHASLERGHGESFEDQFDLVTEYFFFNRLDGVDASGVFGHDAGDGAGAVNTERGEGFQIGFDASAARVVGTCDSEGNGSYGFHGWMTDLRIA